MIDSAGTDPGQVIGRWLLTAGLAALALAAVTGPGEASAAPGDAAAAARADALLADNQARLAAHRAERERYEQDVREAEAARLRYEADLARHREETARSAEARTRYESRLAARETRPAEATAATAGPPATAPDRSCEEQVQRNRSRGRLVGGLLGGAAGAAFGRRGNALPLAAALVPAGAVLGDAIAGLLDCRERRQAAAATEQAVERGVGSTSHWTSETRPGVSGSSTVTAAATGADGAACLTVTDIVIIDGEEQRAPKRMCRRPPANRYVRV